MLLPLLLALLLGCPDDEDVEDAAPNADGLGAAPDSPTFCGSADSLLVASGVPWFALLLVTRLPEAAVPDPVELLPSEESPETPLSALDSSPSGFGDAPNSSFLS